MSQPVTKLIEVVSDALGSQFRPRSIRREADAKAYELKVIAKAEAESEEIRQDTKLEATTSRIDRLFAAHPELAERAKLRLLAREVEGQVNIEAIANHATLALPDAVSNDPVSPDWRRKFFFEAENVCEADLQFLWGKVLAGELTSPGAFGLRTLEVLRNLSRLEAETFRKACAIAKIDGWIAIPGHDLNTALKPFGLSYDDILNLRDAGLMIDGDHIHKNFGSDPPTQEPGTRKIVSFNNQLLIELSGPPLATLQLPVLIFSKAGRELQRLNEHAPNQEYFRALGEHLRSRGLTAKRGVPISKEGAQTIIAFEDDL